MAVLPEDPAEIIRRLRTVNDEPHAARYLYTIVAQSAGRRLVAGGILIMFSLAIHDYVESRGLAEVYEGILWRFIPDWIDALIDDKIVCQLAKRKWVVVMADIGDERQEETPGQGV